MSGITSSNTCIVYNDYYLWVAVYPNGYLCEIQGDHRYSIRDIDQARLQHLYLVSSLNTFKLSTTTGEFYYNNTNITTWPQTYDIRGNIFEYRHVRQHIRSNDRYVFARTIGYHHNYHTITLRVDIPHGNYQLSRRPVICQA